ncbi:AAA family ATPase [Roseibacterium sp. SDUM158017]|uniref:AAA family ATPase n=1 Tax=Roseicyclus salinarum TaxID=3036773 RepID=UPI002414D6B1|nr:AAA family ATPase [Roseibacterium sp. SDUM158017]MDG4648419.1 AAA family ATPase [Roseibacterium sp. SDUM158017]
MTAAFRFIAEGKASRGLVRLSPGRMAALGISPGDTVSLTAARRTHARAVPAAVPDGDLHADHIVRCNAGAAPEGEVTVAAAPLDPLEEVRIRLEGPVSSRPEDVLEALFDMALSVGDKVHVPMPGGRATAGEVRAARPSGAGLVTAGTVMALETPPGAPQGYQGIGGLTEEIARVHEVIAAPLLRPDLFDRLGISPPRGVLFPGPPGSGKTLLAREIANMTRATFFQISGPEIVSKHYGESESALRRVFAAAAKQAPAIVFIDEIDAIAPRRDDLSGDRQVERRIVAQLLTLMDGLSARGQVVVMAATNLPDALDPALRRPGRFDREIAFAPPAPSQRAEILRVHLSLAPLAADADLDRIAQAAHGYVGADLAALAREAAVAALSRAIADAGGEEHVDASSLHIEQSDLEHGLAVTAPSALRGSAGQVGATGMADIGGLDEVKLRLRRAVEWPRMQADALERFRVAPARGILLTGPPGSGKTLIARALAADVGLNFVPVRATDLLTRHFGEAERAIARLFATARQTAPTLLFFDEFDAIAPRRGDRDAVLNRIVAQMLVELDGIAGRDDMVVLAATNRAAAIDPALLRPGRFDEVIEFPVPDAEARRAILGVHLARRPLAANVDLADLARATDGASGADLAEIAAAAARDAAIRQIATGRPDAISREDLEHRIASWKVLRKLRRTDFIAGKDEGA